MLAPDGADISLNVKALMYLVEGITLGSFKARVLFGVAAIVFGLRAEEYMPSAFTWQTFIHQLSCGSGELLSKIYARTDLATTNSDEVKRRELLEIMVSTPIRSLGALADIMKMTCYEISSDFIQKHKDNLVKLGLGASTRLDVSYQQLLDIN